jgi:3-oxosteroid 1-dehydrogenase
MEWDHSVDVLIVGSGNGGMTAAICNDAMEAGEVLVIEKSDRYGGTSALSGGGVWAPNNRYARAAGADDSAADAREYLRQTIPAEMVDAEMLDSYIENAPRMIDFLHDHSRVRYESLAKYPDYYTNLPGARSGHRSMEPTPFSRAELGDDADLMMDPYLLMFSRIGMTQVEAQILSGRLKGWLWTAAKLIMGYAIDLPYRLKSPFARRMTCGSAGIGRLRISMRDRQIPLWLNTEFKELLKDDQRVTGVVVEQAGKTLRIQARKAVILAAGGFEHNQAMREQYLPAPTSTQWSAGCKTNTGDAHRAAMAIGAETALMDNAWWCSVACAPDAEHPFLSIVGKSFPGTIVVNQLGRRFSNESQNYMAFMKETFALHTQDTPCIPHYMIWDRNFREKYRLYPLPDRDAGIPDNWFSKGFVAMGDSLEELADKMHIDAAGLRETVENFNRYASEGRDPDFKRGDSAYDRYYGDPDVTPNPCLGPIVQPPFYAQRIEPGDFGTQGGMVVTTHAQVMHQDGALIQGLYAIGNCSKAVLPTYPGPGSTLGPAMTFAYQAAKHITGYCDTKA